ncbi:MAG: FAD/NAD(P)-binding protein [Vicinamibacteria bacterium]|nr:FAD/NAD(P)-binding protein [Vicinamibacteria bacterium]
MDNAYLPTLARLTEVRDLATGIKLFRCEPLTPGVMSYTPGQFGFLSAIGVGEAPFGMAVSQARGRGQVEFAVQRVGTVTDALHEMQPGEIVGVRGPMGQGFPLAALRGKRIVILGGGIGLAPLRPLIQEILDDREAYGEMTIFCAGRSPDLLVFREEYAEWSQAPRTVVHATVDKGDEPWTGRVGLITKALADIAPSPEGAVAITCGPPIMIKFVLKELTRLGFAPEQIITTLEGKMKCGLGKCGRCNVGEQYICQDGPVFRYDQIQQFLEAF